MPSIGLVFFDRKAKGMRITKSNERELGLLRALVHGDSGVGKTTSLGTLPEDLTLIVAAERGLLPLRNKGFEVVAIESWDDVRQLAIALAGGEASNELKAVISGKKFVAWDSLSEISELCKRHIIEHDRPDLLLERSEGKRSTPKGVYDDLMVMEDWNLYRTRMTSYINAVVHLPFHIVMTCLSQIVENKKTGAQLRTPNLGGKLGRECPAYFDVVFAMESVADAEGKDHRVWRTSGNDSVLCKDSSGVLDVLESPNWISVYKKINKKG